MIIKLSLEPSVTLLRRLKVLQWLIRIRFDLGGSYLLTGSQGGKQQGPLLTRSTSTGRLALSNVTTASGSFIFPSYSKNYSL